MEIYAVDEFNSEGHLIYSSNFIGAFVRGKTKVEALGKFPKEIMQYCRWLGQKTDEGDFTVSVVQEKQSDLKICDADSDVIFDSELPPLTMEGYQKLYALALKSARDFESLYRAVPQKDKPLLLPRKTFYGNVPITASEMYTHTKNVNDYYFGEIGVSADNAIDIVNCRLKAFEKLEKQGDFLQNTLFDGSYGEKWSLRKLCRRFVWHDRIHAKAMYRAAVKQFGKENIQNPFFFDL